MRLYKQNKQAKHTLRAVFPSGKVVEFSCN